MKEGLYNKILWLGLAAVMLFAPLAYGAVQLWALAPIELVVLILVFLWLVGANNRKEKLRKTKIDFPLWLFVILAIVSCFPSIYKYASLAAMLRLLMYLGVFYLVVNKFNRYMSYRLVNLIIIVAALMSILGLGQYFLGLKHSWWKPQEFLAASFVNHNHFAGYLELAIPLAIALLLSRNRKTQHKIGLAFALVVMFLAFIFAQSRGAWASLAISLLVMNVILVKRKVLRKLSIVLFLLLLALGAVYIYAGDDAVALRLQSIEEIDSKGFLAGRSQIWQGAWQMIKDRPLTGTGLGTFVWGFARFRPMSLQVRAHYAHNDYLQMMAEMGVLALPLMLGMLWQILGTGLSRKGDFNWLEAMLLGASIGLLSISLHNLVDFNFHIPANMLVVTALAGIIMRRGASGA